MLLKPLIIPLINITEIQINGFKSWGISTGNENVYVVKFDKKELSLEPHNFKYAKVDLYKFVEELKNRVEIAKEEFEANKNSLKE